MTERGCRSGRPGRNGSRRPGRREQILDIAVAAFQRRGFGGTSVEEISRQLHMTKGSLYYYFRDKEDILFSCHQRSLDHLLSISRGIRRRHPDPESALRELIERHVAIMVEEFRGTALALEVGALTGRRLKRVVDRRDRYERTLRGLIAEGVHSGRFRPVKPKLAVFAVLGAINWMARWYRDEGELGPDEIGRFFAELFIRGLKSSRGPSLRARAGSGPPRLSREP